MKIFDINIERFIFYPHKYFLIAGIVVLISFCLFFIGYSMSKIPQAINLIYIGLFSLLFFAMLIAFYIASRHQIIIDIHRKEIYRKNIFGKKHIAYVKDIEGVRLRDKDIENITTAHYYELVITKGTLQKTVAITPNFHWTSKDLKRFQENALPQLERFLETNQTTKTKNIEGIKRKIKLFKEVCPNYYVYKSGNSAYLIFSILFSAFLIFILANIIPDLITAITIEKVFYSLITIAIFLLIIWVGFNAAGTKTIIDINDRKVIQSVWGKHSKIIDFSDIRGIYMSKTSTNGEYRSVYISSVKYKRFKPINIDISTIKNSNTLLSLAQDLEILLERRIS